MSKVLENSTKVPRMSVTVEARDMLCAVAGPRGWQDTRQSWLARAARSLGFGHRRTRAIFYGEARCITAAEWLALSDKIDALKNAEKRHAEQAHELTASYRNARENRAVDGGSIQRLGDDAPPTGGARHRANDEA